MSALPLTLPEPEPVLAFPLTLPLPEFVLALPFTLPLVDPVLALPFPLPLLLAPGRVTLGGAPFTPAHADQKMSHWNYAQQSHFDSSCTARADIK